MDIFRNWYIRSWTDAYLTDPCDCPSHDIDSHVSIFAWKWIWTFLAVVYLSVTLSYLNHKEQGTSFAMCKKCLVVPKIFLKPAWILIPLIYFSLPLCSVCFIIVNSYKANGTKSWVFKDPSPPWLGQNPDFLHDGGLPLNRGWHIGQVPWYLCTSALSRYICRSSWPRWQRCNGILLFFWSLFEIMNIDLSQRWGLP